MGEVAVHLEDEPVVAGERPRERREVGPPQPLLAGPVEDLHPRVGGGQLVGDLPGPVGGVVVHDQDVDTATAARIAATIGRRFSASS